MEKIKKIEDLYLSMNLENVLYDNGIETIDQLLNYTINKISNFKDISCSDLNELFVVCKKNKIPITLYNGDEILSVKFKFFIEDFNFEVPDDVIQTKKEEIKSLKPAIVPKTTLDPEVSKLQEKNTKAKEENKKLDAIQREITKLTDEYEQLLKRKIVLEEKLILTISKAENLLKDNDAKTL